MRLGRLGRWLWPGLVTVSVACGGDVRSAAVARAPRSAAELPRPQPSWHYHPTSAPQLLARYPLSAQQALYLGRYGDRWLANTAERSVQVASDMAPKALVAALQGANQSWDFVAADGTVYQSPTALGDFQRIRPPPVLMVEATAHSNTVLGIAPGGRLWRSADLGNSWRTAGPAGARFADVAFTGDGTALAFSVPEQHWLSADSGQTWAAAGAPFGALLLSSQADGVSAQGVLGRYRWQRSGSSGSFEPISAPAETLELPFAPPRGPSAAALLAKRAAIVGDDYFELAPLATGSATPLSESSRWQLWSGPLRGPLRATPLPEARCTAVKLAGFSRWLWFACAQPEGRRESAKGDVVSLWSSVDGGRSWLFSMQKGHSSIKGLTLAVGEQGRLLVSGFCPEDKRGCVATGIQHLLSDVAARKGSQSVPAVLQPSVAPSLAGSVEQLLFAPDGRTAYAFGRSTKNDLLALFVSRDGGVSFTPKSVSGVSLRRDGSSPGIIAASATDDDTVTAVFSALPGSTARLLWLDAEGRVLALSATPKERTTLAVQGARAIAIDRNGIGVWESRNAGASWVSRPPLPGAVCVPSARSNECPVEVVCAAAGCVFAESLTRLGWDDSAESGSAPGSVTSNDVAVGSEPRRAAMACRLADAGWQRLAIGASPPTADQAALGGYSWFVVADDPSSAEVELWRASREQAAVVEKRQLLAPLIDAAPFAFHASLQVEGAAAIRYRVPNRVGAAIGRVEVAWEDLVHGVTQHSALAEAGPYRQDDATKTATGAERALPALVSITDGGLYLQVHGESSRDQETFFIDGKGVTALPDLGWPAGLAGARGEYVRVGQTHQPMLFLGSSAVVRAAQHGSTWGFFAHSVGWADPDRFASEQELTLGYWRGRPALQLAWREPNAAVGSAVLLPFQEQGALFAAPMAVPTQADLSAQPQPCAATTLTETPRVVAQPEWGTRHVVTVSDAVTSFSLLTGAAVLHGTKQQPCVAAFEATSWTERRDELLSSIIETDAPERSWLFRQTQNGSLEYRRMSCDFEAATTP